MRSHILNIITQLLAYSDSDGSTNNPKQRAFDWTRRIQQTPVQKPISSTHQLAPGEILTLFDGTRAVGLSAGVSQISVALVSAVDSLYALAITTGPGEFRTSRPITGLAGCAVAVNNNAMATFDFGAATLAGVQVGDIMRISGAAFDTGPFAFSALNAGAWTVIGIAGSKVSVVRPQGECFSGAQETVATVLPSDVSFFSASGTQKGDKFALSGVVSPASQRSYTVADVTPTKLYFVSTMPIPEEGPLTYAANALTVYSAAKRLVYLESDQDLIVRFNGDTGNSVLVNPVVAGDRDLPGYLHKFGLVWKCEVENKSVNPLNLVVCSGE
jgi:hypothetical protein